MRPLLWISAWAHQPGGQGEAGSQLSLNCFQFWDSVKDSPGQEKWIHWWLCWQHQRRGRSQWAPVLFRLGRGSFISIESWIVSWPKFTDDIKTCGRISASNCAWVGPARRTQSKSIDICSIIWDNNQTVMISARNRSFLKDLVVLVCHWSFRSSYLPLIFQTCINISGSVIGAGRWEGSEDGGWLENKDYDLRELLAHFPHLEYIAARKSWMAGSTAEGGQSVIKSVANLTTLSIPWGDVLQHNNLLCSRSNTTLFTLLILQYL